MNNQTFVYVVTLVEKREGSSIQGIYDDVGKAHDRMMAVATMGGSPYSDWKFRGSNVASNGEFTYCLEHGCDILALRKMLVQ